LRASLTRPPVCRETWSGESLQVLYNEIVRVIETIGFIRGQINSVVKFSPQRQWLYWVAVAALVAVFVTLAGLQYRWSQEIADASSVRMRAALQTSMNGFCDDLYREFATVGQTFETDTDRPFDDILSSYVSKLQTWERTATHPGLIAGVYVWRINAAGDSLLGLLPGSTAFRPAVWPENLLSTKRALAPLTATARPPFSPIWQQKKKVFTQHGSFHPPGIGGSFVIARVEPPWLVDEDAPALISRVGNVDPNPTVSSWLIVVLSRDILSTQVLKEIADRHFGDRNGLEYRVAVLNMNRPEDVIFSSDGGFARASKFQPDASAPVFGPFAALGYGAFDAGPGQENLKQYTPGLSWRSRFAPVMDSRTGGNGWCVVAQHREGSLEAAVRKLQQRNLLFSLGVLGVLAIAGGMLFVASQRAHRLAQLQLDFVAGVSHELRTPLTVISSAADNIVDGVVDSKQQATRYGRVIKAQARQLIDIVEQILTFSSTRHKGTQYHIRALDVTEVINDAIRTTAETVGNAGFHLEYAAEPFLPNVPADPMALSQVLQNLINNAVKYGGEEKWIGVTVESGISVSRMSVQIHVSDRGLGIAEADLSRIFEPFYRAPAVTAAQIHGTGLGLAVARTITEAMGARLSVTSKPGAGSTFTVTLPAVETPSSQVDGRYSSAATVEQR
jgi:signal transduction histidine kinase